MFCSPDHIFGCWIIKCIHSLKKCLIRSSQCCSFLFVFGKRRDDNVKIVNKVINLTSKTFGECCFISFMLVLLFTTVLENWNWYFVYMCPLARVSISPSLYSNKFQLATLLRFAKTLRNACSVLLHRARGVQECNRFCVNNGYRIYEYLPVNYIQVRKVERSRGEGVIAYWMWPITPCTQIL